MKRLVDIVLCLGALPLVAATLALVWILTRVETDAPVLYRQTRLGKNRRPFTLLKVRTMVDDPTLRQVFVTGSGDPRITRLGAVLRRLGLDELPQVWNILRGEMSLVGPRPEIPRFVAEYASGWEEVFSVRPGLTDLASLVFRNEEQLLAECPDPEETYVHVILPIKMELVLENLRTQSLWNDFAIILKTAGVLTGILSFDRHPSLLKARERIRLARGEGPREEG